MIKLPRWRYCLNPFKCEINLFKEIKKVTQFYTFIIAVSVRYMRFNSFQIYAFCGASRTRGLYIQMYV